MLPSVEEFLDTGLSTNKKNSNNEKWSHYAESTSVTESYVLGTPVRALCGKIFIATRDPEKFPVCPICKKIVEALLFN
jgi:hypothetical protein